MHAHLIDQYNTLFSVNGIKDPIAKFICYIWSLIAACLREELPGQFYDYTAALFSPRAKPLIAYVNQRPSQLTSELLNQLASIREDSVGREFIAQVVPDLFLGDPSMVFDYLQQFQYDSSLRNNLYTLFKIFGIVSFRRSLYKDTDYPIAVTRYQSEELSGILYSNYRKWDRYPQFSKLHAFEQEQFFHTWLLINGSAFAPAAVKIPRSISAPLKAFRDSGTSDKTILQVFYIAKTFQAFDPKRIDLPIPYLRKVFLKDFGDSSWKGASPGERFFVENENLEKALKSWKAVDPTDFVRALQHSGSGGRAALELSMVLPQLKGKKRVLLVEPNPDFLLQLAEAAPDTFAGYVVAFTSIELVHVYKLQFPDIRMAFLDCHDEGPPSLSLQEIDSRYPSKEKRFLSSAVREEFDRVVFFSRPSYEAKLHLLLRSLEGLLPFNPSLDVLILAPHALLDDKQGCFSRILAERYRILWMLLCPKNTTQSGYRKNLLFVVRPASTSQGTADTIPVVRSLVYSIYEEQELICQDPWGVAVPRAALLEGNKTVNQLWEYYRPRPERRGLRIGDRRVEFSKEIWVWYSWSKGRGRYGFHKCPTEAQLRANPLPRGKRLMESSYSAQTVELAESLIHLNILGSDDLRKVITTEILSHYKNRPMSLKTYWYCHRDELQKNPQYKDKVAAEAFSESLKLSNLISDQDISLQEYQSIIETDFKEKSTAATLDIWRQLNLILRLASKENRFVPNPVSEYLASLNERDKGYRAARDALAKRSYSLHEEQRMLEYMSSQLPENGRLVGCAISFYTGMSDNEICALTWSDFHSVKESDAWQFWVFKKVSKDDGILQFGADDLFSFRRVPCVRPLAAILENRKSFLLSSLDNDTGKLGALPIVPASEEDLAEFCHPPILRKEKDSMETAAGIAPMGGLVAYADNSGKRTDFNEYQADRFRSNFSYRALQTCALSRAELCYVLGKTPPTTFSKHYCDYANDFSQLILARKLERWVSLHQKEKGKEQFHHRVPTAQGIKGAHVQSGNRNTIFIDITTRYSHDEIMTVEISSTRGADLELFRLEGR